MKNLAELKRRIHVGAHITLVDTNVKNHRFLNIDRVVTKALSGSFALATPEQADNSGGYSWLDYGKVAQYTFYPDDPNRFTVSDCGATLTYVIRD